MMHRTRTAKEIRESRKPLSKLPEWTDLIRELPIGNFWLILLAFGGIILLTFFASINYLPELEISDLTVLAAASSIMAILYFLALGSIYLAPTFIFAPSSIEVRRQQFARLTVAFLLVSPFYLLLTPGGYTEKILVYCLLCSGLVGLSKLAIKENLIQFFRKSFTNYWEWCFWLIWIFPVAFFTSLLKFDEISNAPAWVRWLWLLLPIVIPFLSALLSFVTAQEKGLKKFGFFIFFSFALILILNSFANKISLIPDAVMTSLNINTGKKM
jgi:hypothetical protein